MDFLPNDSEVVKKFNAVMRGIANYYCGTEYPSALNELWQHLLKRSLALTLAHRHKSVQRKLHFKNGGVTLLLTMNLIKMVKQKRSSLALKFQR